jgi:hypothetical protein
MTGKMSYLVLVALPIPNIQPKLRATIHPNIRPKLVFGPPLESIVCW